MNKPSSRALKAGGFIATIAASAALIGGTVAGTGAYFSDTKANNTITGTMGSIKVAGHDGLGPNSLNAVFTDMLPGETNSAKMRYSNTGANEQDVWIVFDQKDLGTFDGKTGINSLGTYGEVHVAANGSELFASQNLHDGYPAGTPGINGAPTLNALPSKIKLADALKPGHTGDFSFSFKPSHKFNNTNADGTITFQGAQMLNLHYNLVATQVGQLP